MKKLLLAVILSVGAFITAPAHAQSEASALSALSTLPVASVVAGASAAAGASVAVPVILSAAGAVFVVKAVEVGASSTIYVLERASDAARASVEINLMVAAIAAAAVIAPAAHAGRSCDAKKPTAQAIERGLQLAGKTMAALEASGAKVVPGASVTSSPTSGRSKPWRPQCRMVWPRASARSPGCAGPVTSRPRSSWVR